MSETVIGPPTSQDKFKSIYPDIGDWTPEMTRLSDFSGAKRRNTIKTVTDGDLGTIDEEDEENSSPSKSQSRKRKLEDDDVSPSTSKGKRFKPNPGDKKIRRKFIFEDDNHRFMSNKERQTGYVDEIFDSDSDDDEQAPKKSKSQKKSKIPKKIQSKKSN